jgi:enamine deaminase RidA (YjgF/YER057c/UK114 family)
VKKTHKLLVGSVLLSGSVFAQPAPPPAASGAPPAEGVDISVGQTPTLSVQEMNSQAREYQQSMSQVLKRIHTLEETARKQKDIIKLNCVMDKQVQAKVNANIADQAMAALQENVARADEGGRTHEFTRLTIINQKVMVLGAEAENCIGEDLSFVGATRVDLDIDPNIPRDDPTQPAVPTTPIERPPAASTYR